LGDGPEPFGGWAELSFVYEERFLGLKRFFELQRATAPKQLVQGLSAGQSSANL